MTIRLLGPNDPAVEALKTLLIQHPEMDAEIEIVPWDNYFATLMENLNAETCPFQAVFIPGHVWLDSLIYAGLVAPLPLDEVDEVILADYQVDELLPSIRNESTRAGELFLIPWFSDGHIFFYRNDVVQVRDDVKVPFIRPSIIDNLAAQASRPPREYGLALKAAASEIFLDWLPFLWDFGGELFDDDLNPLFASPQAIDSLEYYIGLKIFCPPDVHKYGNYEIGQALKKGRVGMATTWGGQAAAVFCEDIESEKPLRFRAGVYPQPWNATWGVGLPSHQSPEVRRKTTEWLLTTANSNMDAHLLEVAGSPVRKSTYTPENFERYFWLHAQWEMLQRCRTLPFTHHLSKILGVLYPAVYAAFIGDQSPRQSLRQAKDQIQQAIKKG